MRQYAGFGTAAESNARYRYLFERGQTGLSVAFDLPTQLGYDSDAPQARGEVGKVGVAIDSIADMETLLDGMPLDRVTVSMTINAPAAILLGAAAGRRAPPRRTVRKARRHRPERRAQRVRRARNLHLPADAVDAPGDRRDVLLRARSAAVEHDLDLRLSHSRSRLDRRRRDRLHALQRKGVSARRPRRRHRTARRSRRVSRSSGTRTTTSSKRSRSSAPRATSGQRSCATISAAAIRARRCFAFTRRPAARRSPRRSPRTTSCA